MSTASPSASAAAEAANRDPPSADPRSSSLQRAKINLSYLALGSSAAVAPASLTTRSFLKTTRYVIRYAIRRLVRYAKYAAVGAVVATLGAGLLGTLGSGLAFFAAPGIFGGMAIGTITAMVKYGWRHRGNHFRSSWLEGMRQRASEGHDGAADEKADAHGAEAQKQENKRIRQDVWMRA